jgi:hypothetical protein
MVSKKKLCTLCGKRPRMQGSFLCLVCFNTEPKDDDLLPAG